MILEAAFRQETPSLLLTILAFNITHVVYLLFNLTLRMTSYHMCSALLFLPLAWVDLRPLHHLRWSPFVTKVNSWKECVTIVERRLFSG